MTDTPKVEFRTDVNPNKPKSKPHGWDTGAYGEWTTDDKPVGEKPPKGKVIIRRKPQETSTASDLDAQMAKLRSAVDKLVEERERAQRAEEAAELMREVEISLNLRKPDDWQPDTGPDRLERHVFGDDADLTEEQRRVKSLVGFVPEEPERQLPYREMTAKEIEEAAKRTPYQPRRKKN